MHRTRIGIEANSFVNFPDLQHLIVMVSLFFFLMSCFFFFFLFWLFGKISFVLVDEALRVLQGFRNRVPCCLLKRFGEQFCFFFLPDAVHYQVAILSMKHFPVFCLTSVVFFFLSACLFFFLFVVVVVVEDRGSFSVLKLLFPFGALFVF